jgi:regulatory protein
MSGPRRITGLEPDQARPGAVRLLVDGRLYCTADGEAAATVGLVPGAPLEGELAEAAGRLADAEGAWRAVLRALARRGFATEELRRRLRQRGHPPAAIDAAVDRAIAAGLLDDLAFARLFVSSRADRGRGPARLRRDLAARGVASAVIERALQEGWPAEDTPLEVARRLAEQRAAQLAGLPRPARMRRLAAFLARRGFSGPEVTRLVREVAGGAAGS